MSRGCLIPRPPLPTEPYRHRRNRPIARRWDPALVRRDQIPFSSCRPAVDSVINGAARRRVLLKWGDVTQVALLSRATSEELSMLLPGARFEPQDEHSAAGRLTLP